MMPHSPRLRVLVAGGCHVSGFLVGARRSFPAVLAETLESEGVSVDLQTVTHLPLHKPARLLQACEAFRPDWMILQIGHFELTRKLSDLLPRKRKPVTSNSSATQPFFPQSKLYRMRVCTKLVVDNLLFHPLVRRKEFHRALEQFVSAASRAGVPHTLLLSPLPCIDPVSLGYRLRARPSYESAARAHSLPYLDLLDEVPGHRRCGPDHFYADAAHLGAVGHRLVAGSVAAHMLQSVRPDLAADVAIR